MGKDNQQTRILKLTHKHVKVTTIKMPQKYEYPQISNLSFHINQLEKEEKNKFKACRSHEIIKIKGEIKVTTGKQYTM